MKVCECCGHKPSLKKGKPQEKAKIAAQLCVLMGWSEKDYFRVRNQALTQQQLLDIIKRLTP